MSPLDVLIVVLVLSWLTGGFLIPVGGSLIHLLLVIAVVVLVVRLLKATKHP